MIFSITWISNLEYPNINSATLPPFLRKKFISSYLSGSTVFAQAEVQMVPGSHYSYSYTGMIVASLLDVDRIQDPLKWASANHAKVLQTTLLPIRWRTCLVILIYKEFA